MPEEDKEENLEKLVREKDLLERAGQVLEDRERDTYDVQLKQLDVEDRKLYQGEFWAFLVAKIFVVGMAIWFIGFSINILSLSFDNIEKYKEISWHIPVVIFISLVSGIVAVLAILLKGLSRGTKYSTSDDIPLPALARSLVELYKIIPGKNS